MYGYIMHGEGTIQAYDAVHKEVSDIVGTNDVGGLLVHFAYPTQSGYDLVEVWKSKEQADAFNRDIVSQAFQRLGIPVDGPPPDVTEFEPVEVITPEVSTPTSG